MTSQSLSICSIWSPIQLTMIYGDISQAPHTFFSGLEPSSVHPGNGNSSLILWLLTKLDTNPLTSNINGFSDTRFQHSKLVWWVNGKNIVSSQIQSHHSECTTRHAGHTPKSVAIFNTWLLISSGHFHAYKKKKKRSLYEMCHIFNTMPWSVTGNSETHESQHPNLVWRVNGKNNSSQFQQHPRRIKITIFKGECHISIHL